MVERDSVSVAARIALGDAYADRAYVPEAVREYEEAIRLDPSSSAAWNSLGVAEDLLRHERQANSAFRQAIELNARNAEAHYNLAVELERSRQFEAAVQHLKEAVRIRPDLGDRSTNPRILLSKLMLPVRVSLYLETSGGTTLRSKAPEPQAAPFVPPAAPPVPPRAAPAREQPHVDPVAPAPDSTPEVSTPPTPIAERAPAPPQLPVAAPTPIVLGPGSIPSAGKSSSGSSYGRPTPTPSSGRAGRTVRRGGPLPQRSGDSAPVPRGGDSAPVPTPVPEPPAPQEPSGERD